MPSSSIACAGFACASAHACCHCCFLPPCLEPSLYILCLSVTGAAFGCSLRSFLRHPPAGNLECLETPSTLCRASTWCLATEEDCAERAAPEHLVLLGRWLSPLTFPLEHAFLPICCLTLPVLPTLFLSLLNSASSCAFLSPYHTCSPASLHIIPKTFWGGYKQPLLFSAPLFCLLPASSQRASDPTLLHWIPTLPFFSYFLCWTMYLTRSVLLCFSICLPPASSCARHYLASSALRGAW